jgi:REP-associated tyrosine transposase
MTQQVIAFPSRHGGRREGAGRKPKGFGASERHERRERFLRNTPVLVTVRTVPALRALRRRDSFRAIRWALYTTFQRRDFRVCHVSIQTGHLHLVVEADHHMALARGMQGFQNVGSARHVSRPRCLAPRRHPALAPGPPAPAARL